MLRILAIALALLIATNNANWAADLKTICDMNGLAGCLNRVSADFDKCVVDRCSRISNGGKFNDCRNKCRDEMYNDRRECHNSYCGGPTR
jgi:hypothetical protein